jgi:hypothetical protein
MVATDTGNNREVKDRQSRLLNLLSIRERPMIMVIEKIILVKKLPRSRRHQKP